MSKPTKIGIWMDHSVAHFINYNSGPSINDIESNFTFEVKAEALSRNENLMHNKENQSRNLYYKAIADKVKCFDHILLFGPTDAKKELHNYLRQDIHFNDKIIVVKSTDKMTENQKAAYVNNFFTTELINT